MLKLKLVVMEEGYEKSLLQLLSGKKGYLNTNLRLITSDIQVFQKEI
jgi:hypothetical protein